VLTSPKQFFLSSMRYYMSHQSHRTWLYYSNDFRNLSAFFTLQFNLNKFRTSSDNFKLRCDVVSPAPKPTTCRLPAVTHWTYSQWHSICNPKTRHIVVGRTHLRMRSTITASPNGTFTLFHSVKKTATGLVQMELRKGTKDTSKQVLCCCMRLLSKISKWTLYLGTRLRIRGAILPLPHTSSWREA
jgi:hypothetical protein